MKKIKLFLIYIYLIPTILSIMIIYKDNHLLGDFRYYLYNLEITDAIVIFLEFISPLIIKLLAIKVSSSITLSKPKNIDFENFIIFIFIFIFIVTLFFGVTKVGQGNNLNGLPELLVKITAKLNPYLLIGILAFSNIKNRNFIFCLIVCVFYSYKQISLQGYLIVIFSYSIYLLNKNKINSLHFSLLLVLPFILHEYMFNIIQYIYTMRNEMRGFNFIGEDIITLTIGRISSISSYLYIKENTCDINSISSFFSLGLFQERIFGFSFLDTVSPSNVFNLHELGDANYSIFLGLNGFLHILFRMSLLESIFNIVIIFLSFFMIFQLIPYFEKKQRISLFFIIMYMPILSFDIWEISILFQSLILINILYLIYRKIFSMKLI